MLRAYLVLLACQGFGEFIHLLTGLPLSGPIVGMVLLLVLLRIQRGVSDDFKRAAESMLRYLPLFFVPAGVGIIQHLSLLRAVWLPILLSIIVSTFLAMISGALVMQSVIRLRRNWRPILDVSSGTD